MIIYVLDVITHGMRMYTWQSKLNRIKLRLRLNFIGSNWTIEDLPAGRPWCDLEGRCRYAKQYRRCHRTPSAATTFPSSSRSSWNPRGRRYPRRYPYTVKTRKTRKNYIFKRFERGASIYYVYTWITFFSLLLHLSRHTRCVIDKINNDHID